VPHQDRRELRGSYVLAAWLDHFDARDQNTLAVWVKTNGGRGYVRHALIDWGDCLGGLWGNAPAQARRGGHSYYFDLPQIAGDFVTFGARERPWDRSRFGPAGPALGYFDVARFDPDDWKPHYPNPAFVRRTERDAAWMTRIVAAFDDQILRAIVEEAKIMNHVMRDELLRTLIGRRDAIKRRFFGKLSSLARPRVERSARLAELCFDDLAGVPTRYAGAVWINESRAGVAVQQRNPFTICVPVGDYDERTAATPDYFAVDVWPAQDVALAARAHVYRTGPGAWRVTGLERSALADLPPL
jgi:hypothetical protein